MTDLWYDQTGEGSPILLIHEGVVDSRLWDPVLPLLADRHRVIRYDQRGFGRSPAHDGPYSLVEDLTSVLDAAGVEQAALVGASRGGGIALGTALDRPERVSALVIVVSALPGQPLNVEWTPEQIARWELAEESEDYNEMAELDMEVWAPLGVDDALRTMFLENAKGSNTEHETTDRPVADRLGEIAVPTLVVSGARDVDAINDNCERIAREIAGAQRAVVEEADHMLPWRAPQELADLVLRFLKS
jgi:3-oxoadipate enol-lactonase